VRLGALEAACRLLKAMGWGPQAQRAPGPMVALRPEHWRAFSYVMLNMVSATGIVFANKLVLSVLDFHFVRPVVPGAPAAHSRAHSCARGCAGLQVAALCWTCNNLHAAWRAGVRAHICAQRVHDGRDVAIRGVWDV